jgi:outer membrane protein
MNMKRLLVIIALPLTLMSTQVEAELKVGFVNTAQILKQAPQAEQASSRLQAEFASREAEVIAEAKKLKAKEEALKRDAPVMSEDDRRKIERDIVNMRRDIKRAEEEFNEDLNLRRNEEFAKLQRNVAQAIVDMAKEENFDVIFESGVVYASERVDITKKLLERLNKLPSGNNKK